MYKQNSSAYQPSYDQYQRLVFPETIPELLKMYQHHQQSFTCICILAKIKHLILESVPSLTDSKAKNEYLYSQLSESNFQNIPKGQERSTKVLFSAIFLKFLKKGYRHRLMQQNQVNLFYHVISLGIKYYYSEQNFRFLFNEITDYIDSHKERVQVALQFFIEVIKTVQYNQEQSSCQFMRESKKSHCSFERHFMTNHLNSMLMIANFFMQRSVLREHEAVEDGFDEDSFKIRTSQEHIILVLQLLHRVFCFDFIGQKYGDYQETSQLASIIIPTKNPKNANISQFEKWLRNSEWIRIYLYLYNKSHSLKLKLIVIEIFGDLTRIHMKFFKNKISFKTHIENIIYSFAGILQNIEINRNSQQAIQIAIAVGRNLIKLTTPSVIPLFFEININFSSGLLNNIRRFLVEQVISEQIFNVNIIFYFFKFLQNIHKRLKFQKVTVPLELIEQHMRQICRNYQNYLRNLLAKVYRQKPNDFFNFRQYYISLRQTLDSYNIPELQVYFIPFKLMKPRYTNVNTIQELVVNSCAKFQRSIYILESYKLQNWERQISVNSISQCIDKVIEWYSYTSYAKKRASKNNNNTSKRPIYKDVPIFQGNQQLKKGLKIELKMQSILEQYCQEIENENEYCHLLRVIIFYIIDSLNAAPFSLLKMINAGNQIFKMISLGINLCFFSDLQESQNEESRKIETQIIIQQYMQKCYNLLERILIRQWEYQLFILCNTYQHKKIPYKYVTLQSQIELLQLAQIQDKIFLCQSLKDIKVIKNEKLNQAMQQMLFIVTYNIAKETKKDFKALLQIQNIYQADIYLSTIVKIPVVLTLFQQNEPVILQYLSYACQYLQQYQIQGQISEIMAYIQCLISLAKTSIKDVQQQANNKLFVFLKKILTVIANKLLQLDIQFLVFIERINDEHISKIRDLDFQNLSQEIRSMVNQQRESLESKMEIINVENYQKEYSQNKPNCISQDNQQQTQILESSQQYQKQMQKSNDVHNGYHKDESQKRKIYNGFHRDQTLSILSKYIAQQQEDVQKSIQQGQDHQSPMDIQSPVQQIDTDSTYVEQITNISVHEHMEIEHHQQKDYVQVIQKMVQQEQNHICLNSSFFPEAQQLEQINEQCIQNQNSGNQPQLLVQFDDKKEVSEKQLLTFNIKEERINDSNQTIMNELANETVEEKQFQQRHQSQTQQKQGQQSSNGQKGNIISI